MRDHGRDHGDGPRVGSVDLRGLAVEARRDDGDVRPVQLDRPGDGVPAGVQLEADRGHPEAVLGEWLDKPITELVADDFGDVFDASPELVLLGTGPTNIFPPRELMFAFARKGIGFEVMDTPAAARTFNVLANEGRRVAVILNI